MLVSWAVVISLFVLALAFYAIRSRYTKKIIKNISYETILSKNKEWEYYLVVEYKTKFIQVLKEEYFISFKENAHDWRVLDLVSGKRYYSYLNKRDAGYLFGNAIIQELLGQIEKSAARKKIDKYFENIIEQYDQNIEKQFKELEKKKKKYSEIKVRIATPEIAKVLCLEEPAKNTLKSSNSSIE